MAGLATGKRQQEQVNDLIRALQDFEWDMHSKITARGYFPREWREVWETRSHRKTRVTIRVDDDVLKFFRSMGDGYGPRMNTILRAFMQTRLSGLIEGEDLAARFREDWMGKPRPSSTRIMAELRGKLGEDPDVDV